MDIIAESSTKHGPFSWRKKVIPLRSLGIDETIPNVIIKNITHI